MRRLITRSVVTWIAFVLLAIANGVVRERVYGPHVRTLTAHQISTVAGALAFAGFAWAMFRDVAGRLSPAGALAVGAGWASATIAFEVSLGRFVRGLAWSELLADYNVCRGRLWGLFLLVVLLTPTLLRQRQARASAGVEGSAVVHGTASVTGQCAT